MTPEQWFEQNSSFLLFTVVWVFIAAIAVTCTCLFYIFYTLFRGSE